MKKAMAYFLLSQVLFTSSSFALTDAKLSVEQVAMAYVPGNPLMQLPGMRSTTPQIYRTTPAALPPAILSNLSNAPNPFDSRKPGNEGRTRISYVLDRDAPVRVTMYDLLGFRVKRWDFIAGQEGARSGENAFFWDGTNEAGQNVSKGGYIAHIEVETPEGIASAIRKIGVIH